MAECVLSIYKYVIKLWFDSVLVLKDFPLPAQPKVVNEIFIINSQFEFISVLTHHDHMASLDLKDELEQLRLTLFFVNLLVVFVQPFFARIIRAFDFHNVFLSANFENESGSGFRTANK